MNYNSFYPYRQPYQQPYMQQPVQQPMQPQQPTYTPPTIVAEIVQVPTREDGKKYGVAPGQTQMMMLKDESAIFIKTVLANNQYTFDEYIKKEPEAEEQPEYITKAELEKRIAEVVEKLTASAQAAPKGNEDNEYI